MRNPQDVREKQFQVAKIVASGSTGTGAKLLIYSEESELKSNPNEGRIDPDAFDTGSIGTDILMYVSGTVSSGSSTDRITVFGGTVVISGSIGIKSYLTSAYGLELGVVNEDDGKYGVFPIFKNDDADIITTSSYEQISSAFDSYLFDQATADSKVIYVSKSYGEFITSGNINRSLGKNVRMVSGYKQGGPDYGFGFSSFVVTGSHVDAVAAGNNGSRVYHESRALVGSADITYSASGSLSSSATVAATGDSSSGIMIRATGSLTASLAVTASSPGVADIRLKANSFGVSASLDVTASADAFARVTIGAETTDTISTSSVEFKSKHLHVSRSLRVGFNINTSGSRMGHDTLVHVSGGIGERNSPAGKIAVFGGDLVLSGNTFLGGGSNLGARVMASGSGQLLTEEMTGLHMSATLRDLYVMSSSVEAGTGRTTFKFNDFNVLRDLRPHHYWNAENVVTGAGGLILTMSDLGSIGINFTQSNSIYQCTRGLDDRGRWALKPDGADDHYSAGTRNDWAFMHQGRDEFFLWILLERTGAIPIIGAEALHSICVFDTTSFTSLQAGIGMYFSKNQQGGASIQQRVLETDWGFKFQVTTTAATQFAYTAQYYVPTPQTRSMLLLTAQVVSVTGSSAKGGFNQEAFYSVNGASLGIAQSVVKCASGTLNLKALTLFAPSHTLAASQYAFDGRFYEMGIVKGLVPKWKVDRLTQWIEEYYGPLDRTN